MELWDAYDHDGNLTGKTLVRGEKVPEGLYHRVCSILVQHADGEYLLMRRAYDKKGWPGVFEASAGGAVQKGEDVLQAARRELAEETGITRGEFSLLYTEEERSALFTGYLCVTDWPKDGIVLQEGETVEYRWVTADELRAMMDVQPYEVWVQYGVRAYLAGQQPPIHLGRSILDEATCALRRDSVIAHRGAHRPAWKLAPQSNWMNDPNGLIWFRGQYHAFWQSYPYAPEWHSMHWAHAVSSDLIHWTYLPVALAPDQPYEDDFGGGCFSGTAIEKDGRLYLLYTAHAHGRETQCLAWSDDGVHFEKYAGNPVIAQPPEGHDVRNFRDPKVLRAGDHYYLVVGSCIGEWGPGEGCAVLYRSDDLMHWTYMGIAARSGGQFGTMWECPDLFEVDGKWVLAFSPQQMEGRRTCWMVGSMDFEKGIFTRETDGTLDHGWEYYAPQTFQQLQGRCVQLGWQSSWGERVGNTVSEGWRWSMALPRELSVGTDGRLRIRPAREIFCQTKPAGDGSVYGRRIILQKGRITLWPRGREEQDVYVRVDADARLLEMGRMLPGDAEWDVKRYPLAETETEVLLFADRNAIEVFADGGRLALSCCELSPGEGLKYRTENAECSVSDCMGV